MDSSYFELSEFFSVCTQLVEFAGKIIRDIGASNNLNVKLKGFEDPFTDADVKVQTLILRTLRHFWPDIQIIGEESVDFEGEIGVDYKNFKKDLISSELYKGFESTKVGLKNSIVWVDPLDGTKDFVQGYLNSVTTLIGVSIDGKASIGVIGKHFVDSGEPEKYLYQPKCFFGHANFKNVYIYDYSTQNISKIEPNVDRERFILGITRNPLGETLTNIVAKIQPKETVKLGGAGNKILCVIDGTTDCYLSLGLNFWDICAGEAILKGLGGNITDETGACYEYSPQNAKSYTEVCVQIVDYAGKIIRDISASNNLNMKLKGYDDPVTEADIKVQTLVVKALRHFWPEIHIIGNKKNSLNEGEESVEYQGDLGVDYKVFKKDFISSDLFKGIENSKIDLKTSTVWVDPLDGTKDFVNGKINLLNPEVLGQLDAVTTLIGVAVNGEAKVGVIGKHFIEIEDSGKYEFQPKCFFGHSNFKTAYKYDYIKKEVQKVEPNINSQRFILGVTRNHMNANVLEKIEKIKPEKVLKIGGAGNKMLCVIDGTIDCYIYPSLGMKFWDICAGDAILKALGGKLTDVSGKLYQYQNEGSSSCDQGVLACFRKDLFDHVIKSLET